LIKLASFKSKDYKAALEECFFKMDEMMRTPAGKKELAGFQSGDSAESFAGCTATTLLITPTELYCANSGDSRTVLSRGK
jgi:protein phosphatase 2C family protein 2/3